MSLMSHFLSIYKNNPLYPLPSPYMIILLLIYYYLNYLFSLSTSIVSLSLFKKKWSVFVAWLDMLDLSLFFLQRFPFYFRFILRAPSCYYTWLKNNKKRRKIRWLVALIYSTHSQTREKWTKVFSSLFDKGERLQINKSKIYTHNIDEMEPDLVTFSITKNHWIIKTNHKKIFKRIKAG
jgi:hypothetical protein